MKRRIFSILVCILMFFTVSMSANAASTGSITVNFRHEGMAVPNATFRIYKVAVWNGDRYVLTGAFASLPVQIPKENSSSQEWQAAAGTLAAYAARNRIPYLAQRRTGSDGKVRFEPLTDGLYLVVGDNVVFGDEVLYPQPMLVSVTTGNRAGEDRKNVVVTPKYDWKKIPKKTKIQVQKIWLDGGAANRPDRIVVQLLRDGKVFAEKVLDRDNNWRFEWDDLDPEHFWQIVEKEVPPDYSVSIEQNGTVYTIKNKKDPPPTTGESTTAPKDTTEPSTGGTTGSTTGSTTSPQGTTGPSPTGTTGPTGPSDGTTGPGTTDSTSTTMPYVTAPVTGPNSTTAPGTSENKPKPHLPQTGLLWWPVPVLAVAGAAALCAGIFLFLKKRNGTDE